MPCCPRSLSPRATLNFQRNAKKLSGEGPLAFHARSFLTLQPSSAHFAPESSQMQVSLPPPWWIFHVPHDATLIPAEVRDQFILADDFLNQEILRMTDHHTLDLFAADVPKNQVVKFPVSRLVVDVERFEQDAAEPMSARGMGAIYRVTHDLRPLRRSLTPSEIEGLAFQELNLIACCPQCSGCHAAHRAVETWGGGIISSHHSCGQLLRAAKNQQAPIKFVLSITRG